jgi:hypothetical protein
MRLTYYGFSYLTESDLAASPEAVSLQVFRPSSEEDLVIGDHVIFWNHRAYDLINKEIRNAWRLENAILIEKRRGQDLFLGHGSGQNTNEGLRGKLAQEYNDVVAIANRIIRRTRVAKYGTASAARQKIREIFANIREEN